jgi:hypothetical protein
VYSLLKSHPWKKIGAGRNLSKFIAPSQVPFVRA